MEFYQGSTKTVSNSVGPVIFLSGKHISSVITHCANVVEKLCWSAGCSKGELKIWPKLSPAYNEKPYSFTTCNFSLYAITIMVLSLVTRPYSSICLSSCTSMSNTIRLFIYHLSGLVNSIPIFRKITLPNTKCRFSKSILNTPALTILVLQESILICQQVL